MDYSNNEFLNYTQLKNYDNKIKNWVYDYIQDTLDVDILPSIPVVDTTLSTTSNNAIANSTVAKALNSKASTSVATTSTNGLMSSTDKTKLNGIATGANKTTIDTTLSSTSTNPVRNSVINTALNNKQSKIVAGNNVLTTGIGMYCYNSSGSTLGQVELGVFNQNSTSSYKSKVSLTQYAASLRIDNTYIQVTPAQIKFIVQGTTYSLNVTKAKELGVLV